jgi:hypothetical protein
MTATLNRAGKLLVQEALDVAEEARDAAEVAAAAR